jgi:hypothetical protein
VPAAQLPPSGGGGGPYAQQILEADQAAIGTTATAITGLTVPLLANRKYRVRYTVWYTQVAATTVHAARLAYSGTLAPVAQGVSEYVIWGTNGNPTVWAAAARQRVAAINSAMPTTTAGLGNTGAAANIACFEVEAIVCTANAGDLSIPAQSSAALGFIPKAGSRVEAWDITAST